MMLACCARSGTTCRTLTPDVNILVAASRTDHRDHRPAADWIEGALAHASAEEPLVLLPMVLTGFLRIVQLPAPFPTPTPAADALHTAEDLLRFDHVVMAPLGGEWPIFAELFRTHMPKGSSVTDAWTATSVIHLDEHLVTFDRGFRRLLPASALTVLDPTAS